VKSNAFLRNFILIVDTQVHFAVALVLLACAVVALLLGVPGLFEGTIEGLLLAVNNVLLALIFLEILWPVVRFIQKKPFRLHPFIYVGIISSTRRILLIEAEHSVVSRAAHEGPAALDWQTAVSLGVNVGVILILAVALRVVPTHSEEDEL